MKKYIIFAILIFIPLFTAAQSETSQANNLFFKARVIEIIEEKETVLPDGKRVEQQNIRLRGLEGEYEGKEVVYRGIEAFDVLNKHIYKEGDRVLVVASQTAEGEVSFFITDYVRTDELFYLFLLFAVAIVAVGRFKGLRSLISLLITFLIIVKYVIPQILSGANPLWITLSSSFVIIIVVIYITEGLRARSHISVLSAFLSLILTIIISWIFVAVTKLSGFVGEEMAHLVDVGTGVINFKGLLLAGIIIGALGVLDDVIVSQVVAVEQINDTDKHLSKKELFKKSYEVGVSHVSSMTNTLFLAYAGVSLPLLILFISGRSAFSSFSQVINNEVIATEIVRTMAGSIGLIMAVPIATSVAVWWYKKN